MFSITKDGKELSKELYTRDEDTKTLSTKENGLVLDFSNYDECIFNTGSGCTFNTGSGCIFNTEFDCVFNTGSGCIFNTGFGCIFNTGSGCIFNTEFDCVFKTGSGCTFNTGFDCVVVRRDIYEVIELKEGEKIKLNQFRIKGYTVIEDTHTIKLDGKEIKLSKESYEELKKQFK